MAAIGGATIAAADKALKLVYKNGVQGCEYENSQYMGMVSKATSFPGKTHELVLKYSKPQGGGPVYEEAQGSISGTEYDKFQVPRKKYYWFVRIDNETMGAASTDVGAVVNLSKEEISGARDEFVRWMGVLSWGDGSGALTTIKSTTTLSTTTIIPENATDCYFFQPNMYLSITTNKTTQVPGSARVTAVDEDAGTITIDTATNAAFPGVAVGAYIHRKGDIQKAPMGVGGYIVGKSGGNPGTLYSLDRNVYPSRLAGYSFDCTGKSYTQSFVDGFQKQAAGSKPGEHIFMSSTDMGKFLIQAEAKGWRTDRAEIKTKVAGVSYEGIEVYTPSGKKVIVNDPNLLPGKAYNLNMKNWTWRTDGPFPKLITDSGKTWVKIQSADVWESVLGMYGNNECDNPGNNAYYYNLGTG